MSVNCILPENVQRFEDDVNSGKINPDQWALYTPTQRKEAFRMYFDPRSKKEESTIRDIKKRRNFAKKALDGASSKRGKAKARKHLDSIDKEMSESASSEVSVWANTKFENSILLDKQKEGLNRLVKEMKDVKPDRRSDIHTKIESLGEALNTKGKQEGFLEDIIAKKMGSSISSKESEEIYQLTKIMKEQVVVLDALEDKLENTKEGTPEYDKIVNELKEANREWGNRAADVEIFVIEASLPDPTVKGNAAEAFSALTRGLITTGEFSFMGRQGFLYAGESSFNSAALNVGKYFKSDSQTRLLMGEILSHKYADKLMKYKKDLGLTVFARGSIHSEEHIASKYMRNIPVLAGYTRSYEGFATELRFRRMVKILNYWETSGKQKHKDMFNNPKDVQDLARQISINSGRGMLGHFELASGDIGALAFSARLFAANYQRYTGVFFRGKAGRAEAVKGLMRGALVYHIAKAAILAMGGEVEDDPTSSDYGKGGFGNLRFDISGGNGTLITLVARMATAKSKSARTGIVKDLSGRELWKILLAFHGNKRAPLANVIASYIKGKDFDYNEINLDMPLEEQGAWLAKQLLYPMITTSIYDAHTGAEVGKEVPHATLAFFAEMIGAASSTFDRSQAMANDEYYKTFFEKLGSGENPFSTKLKEEYK